MKKREIISILIGALVLFIWNAISWMALPFHTNTLSNIPENVIQVEVMKSEMPASGVYHFPGLPASNTPDAIQEVEEKLAEGPRITMMAYVNRPTNLFEPTTYAFSFLINLLTAFFTLLVVAKIAPKQPATILLTTLTVRLITTLVSDLNQMNWFMFPFDFTIVNFMDKIVAFGLLGTVYGFYTYRKSPA